VPIPGLTALRALRRGGFLLHKRVMITGATGIVGSIAIELAAASGAQVGCSFPAPRAWGEPSDPIRVRN